MGPIAWDLSDRSPELRSWVLLSALLGESLAPAHEALLVSALADPDAFAALVAAAERERVLPAVHPQLSGRFESAGKFWSAVASKAHQENRRRNGELRTILLQLGAAAARANLCLVALKGAAWLAEDEGELAGWRWMIDLDLLVEPTAFYRMPDLLSSLGYEPASHAKRYRNNFHHAPYWRANGLPTIEVHRHLGWRHELLPPKVLMREAQCVAPGLFLAAPWCRALHAIIHWQIQDFGFSRRLIRLKDVVEVSRFVQRQDVDWDKLARHARDVGAVRQCVAAVAITAELLGTNVPEALGMTDAARRHVRAGLAMLGSPVRSWFATELWRAGTLWHCDKIAYRLSLSGLRPLPVRLGVWIARIIRLPLLAVRALGILMRALLHLARMTSSAHMLRPRRSS